MKACPICKQYYSLLEEHHIIPRKILGKLDLDINDKRFIVYLCRSCHGRVYIPGEKNGIHSVQRENAIIIYGWQKLIPNSILVYEEKHITKLVEIESNKTTTIKFTEEEKSYDRKFKRIELIEKESETEFKKIQAIYS